MLNLCSIVSQNKKWVDQELPWHTTTFTKLTTLGQSISCFKIWGNSEVFYSITKAYLRKWIRHTLSDTLQKYYWLIHVAWSCFFSKDLIWLSRINATAENPLECDIAKSRNTTISKINNVLRKAKTYTCEKWFFCWSGGPRWARRVDIFSKGLLPNFLNSLKENNGLRLKTHLVLTTCKQQCYLSVFRSSNQSRLLHHPSRP